MYIVGHCHVTRLACAFDDDDVFGSGLRWLMMPDYVNGHDWGYESAWDAQDLPSRLVRAHMAGDWYVHFGDERTAERRRIGWAYDRMAIAARMYDEFFGQAAAAGLRDPGPPADSIRGFSHTMVELSIDTHLARQGLFDDWFDGARAAIDRLDDLDDVRDFMDRRRVSVDGPIEPETANYRDRTLRSTGPEELAWYAAARKFGLDVCAESCAFVGRFQARILAELAEGEIDAVVARTAAFVSHADRAEPRRSLTEGA